MQARVRVGGANENRVTGNMVAYAVTHRDTRINADDSMPDMNLHKHCFVFNATYDADEGKWKAAEVGQLKKDAPYYEAIYANRLAANVKDLGYGIERRGKSFEITGISQELRDKFSRRKQYIDMVAKKLGITNPESRAKLGATTRLQKSKELADDLQPYYSSRLAPQEKQQLASLEGKLSRATTTEAAVAFAIGHMFERQSVVNEKRLYETAIRHGIGWVTPEEVQQEAKRQGLLVRNGEATTRGVLAEESRVIAFARDGKGTCRPMGAATRLDESPNNTRIMVGMQGPGRGDPGHTGADVAIPAVLDQQQKGRPDESKRPMPALRQGFISDTATLSPEQQAGFDKDIHVSSKLSPEQASIARHVWNSPDRVILIRGAAGTGKTHTMKTTFAGIDRPVVVLAPSADASRGVLRKEGFTNADTVARFLIDQEFQHKAKNGVIWVDEAGLLGMRQTRQVFDLAEKLNARVVLQGDKQQHGSIERGTTLRVLEQFAGLPVAQLTDIRRQKGRYKEAVTALSKGKMLAGYDTLNDLGWVKSTTGNTPLVDEYMEAIDTKRADQDITDRVLAIAPTHAEAAEVTDAIRLRLQERGIVAKEEHEIQTLVPLHWTEAERGDLSRYEGTEVVQYHRNGGTQKAGQRVAIADFKPGMRLGPASTFSVYGKNTIKLAAGDRIRITAPGKSADTKHKLDNGTLYEVKGFDEKGGIVLNNDWTLAPDFAHLTHGYVTTSHASQGKTVDKVLIAMGQESLPAISAEQFYVSVSRGRDKATIFTDVPTPELREAIQKADTRKSATELFNPLPRNRMYAILKRAREAFQALRTRHVTATHERDKQRELGNGR
ncbi:Multifunctional conjugation protein TraI [Gemmata obscuriglobus]|nr:Multifunctional conjugation protein TraI [Gemmata obscuriglobus]VTS09541.1 conjugative relaxase domain-containing protein : Conjugative relaxase domain-containing protein OS=Rhodopirellula europaea 6C GN=RE6C_04182 PE=4 SV=1: TrwC: AAA_30: Viral_helicase1 [Gemmata obscuriglobus UQM 2246]